MVRQFVSAEGLESSLVAGERYERQRKTLWCSKLRLAQHSTSLLGAKNLALRIVDQAEDLS